MKHIQYKERWWGLVQVHNQNCYTVNIDQVQGISIRISICVLGTQKGDNPTIYKSELLPLFCKKNKSSDKDHKVPTVNAQSPGSTPFYFYDKMYSK